MWRGMLRYGKGTAVGCEMVTRLCHTAVQAAKDAGGGCDAAGLYTYTELLFILPYVLDILL